MNTELSKILRRVEDWPESAQAELAALVREIEAQLAGGQYRASAAERAGIDRGLSDVKQRNFATGNEVEAVFAKHRRQ